MISTNLKRVLGLFFLSAGIYCDDALKLPEPIPTSSFLDPRPIEIMDNTSGVGDILNMAAPIIILSIDGIGEEQKDHQSKFEPRKTSSDWLDP